MYVTSERLTSLSAEVCVRLALGGVADVVYGCLQKMNRSVACAQVYPHALGVLLNLAKVYLSVPILRRRPRLVCL